MKTDMWTLFSVNAVILNLSPVHNNTTAQISRTNINKQMIALESLNRGKTIHLVIAKQIGGRDLRQSIREHHDCSRWCQQPHWPLKSIKIIIISGSADSQTGSTGLPQPVQQSAGGKKKKILKGSLLSVFTGQLVIRGTACRQWSGALHRASATLNWCGGTQYQFSSNTSCNCGENFFRCLLDNVLFSFFFHEPNFLFTLSTVAFWSRITGASPVYPIYSNLFPA